MKTTIPQILEEVNLLTKRELKLKTLRSYDSPVLRGILKLNFDENEIMDLPPGEPPFRKDIKIPEGYSETNLYVEFRRFYIWMKKTSNPNLSKVRKESLFVQMLEGLHWKEAEVVCLAKDKKLETKYSELDYDLVYEAFTGLLPFKKKEEKKPKKSLNEKETSLVSLENSLQSQQKNSNLLSSGL